MKARKMLLFHKGVTWVKQSDNEDSQNIDKSSVGLYRDDRLRCL